MTTIVVKDDIMVSDSLVTGDGYKVGYTEKIFRLSDGSIFGFAGSAIVGRKLLRALENALAKNPDSHTDIDGIELPDDNYQLLLLTYEGSLFYTEAGKGWMEVTQPYAIGSGDMIAFGALDHGASAIEAVRIAINRDTSSGGGLQILDLGVEEPLVKLGEEV